MALKRYANQRNKMFKLLLQKLLLRLQYGRDYALIKARYITRLTLFFWPSLRDKVLTLLSTNELLEIEVIWQKMTDKERQEFMAANQSKRAWILKTRGLKSME